MVKGGGRRLASNKEGKMRKLIHEAEEQSKKEDEWTGRKKGRESQRKLEVIMETKWRELFKLNEDKAGE